MLKLSPFSISIYKQCPRRYKFHYVDGLIRQYKKPWPWLTMGGHVHSVLADFMSIIPIEKRNVDTIEDLLRRKWAQNREGFADAEEEKDWGEKALTQLRWFVETQRLDISPLMVERFHEAPVNKELMVMGRIDRIDRLADGSLHVIDYKTGAMSEPIDKFQLLIYSLILSTTVTYPVSTVSNLYLADGAWQTFPILDDDVDDAKGTVINIANQIQQEIEYPEVTSPLCKYCDFLEMCEAGRQR